MQGSPSCPGPSPDPEQKNQMHAAHLRAPGSFQDQERPRADPPTPRGQRPPPPEGPLEAAALRRPDRSSLVLSDGALA
eukprot:999735-Pyramimonas_sp.AAC.1